MAARMVISKLTHNEANVKVTTPSADTATIHIQTDLLLASETVNLVSVVNIDKIMWSVAPTSTAYMTITRNGVVIATLFNTGEMNLNSMGMTEDENNINDIVITFVGSGGSVFMKLKKVTGYGD